MKEINLREILMQNGVDIQDDYVGENQPLINVLDAMKNACEQTVDLCTENAEAYFIFNQRIYHNGAYIEKNSILNTKNQIV